ncbi:MAG: protease modulator HflC [Phycisphaerae bacterium]|nr:protease modulator HflC [Phycisphaerae bacterium]
MRNFWTILCVLLVVFILVLSSVMFQVRQTEKVIITRFGEPVRTIDRPGLKFKYPKPIEVVERFDSRSRLFQDTPEEETATAGGEPIIVKTFVVWRIAEPKTFLVSVKDVVTAEDNLKSLLRNKQNSVIGRHYFSEFVNTDPEKIQFQQIETEIANEIRSDALNEYGIEVQSVGIKRLMISKDVTEKVFDRMKADRNRKTESILAAGNAEAERIKSDAEAKQKELLAVADAQAKQIRGAGDAEAAKYYKMLEADPDLAMFLRDIEALKKILAERSTIVLGVETEPIQLLKELPDIKPKQNDSEAQK